MNPDAILQKVHGLYLLSSFFPSNTVPALLVEAQVPSDRELIDIGEGSWFIREGRVGGPEWGAPSRVLHTLDEVKRSLAKGVSQGTSRFIVHRLDDPFWKLSYVGAVSYWPIPVPTIEIAFQAVNPSILERLRNAEYSPRDLEVQALFVYDYLVGVPSRTEGVLWPHVATHYSDALSLALTVGQWMSELAFDELVCRFLLSATGRLILTDLRSPASFLGRRCHMSPPNGG